MPNINARLVGLELYFEDLTAAKRFYEGTLASSSLESNPAITLSSTPGLLSCAWKRRESKTIRRTTRQ